jgi:hypothetical protein
MSVEGTMPNYDDRLKDYVDVKERVRLFYDRHPDGRLVTADISMSHDPDGTVRVWGKALAYRSPEDPLPGVGWSYMAVPGTTPYTRGSEVENVETSAWGRAIGALGIGIDKSIASADEIANKDGEKERIPAVPTTHDGGLLGVAEVGTARDSDFELRESPDGWTLGFRLKANGRGGIKVLARDALALGIAASKESLVGQRVTCWGHISDESFTPSGSKRKVTYQVLQLERMTGPDFVMPGVTDANPDGVTPMRPEAPSVPVWEPLDDDEKAAIAGSLPGA